MPGGALGRTGRRSLVTRTDKVGDIAAVRPAEGRGRAVSLGRSKGPWRGQLGAPGPSLASRGEPSLLNSNRVPLKSDRRSSKGTRGKPTWPRIRPHRDSNTVYVLVRSGPASHRDPGELRPVIAKGGLTSKPFRWRQSERRPRRATNPACRKATGEKKRLGPSFSPFDRKPYRGRTVFAIAHELPSHPPPGPTRGPADLDFRRTTGSGPVPRLEPPSTDPRGPAPNTLLGPKSQKTSFGARATFFRGGRGAVEDGVEPGNRRKGVKTPRGYGEQRHGGWRVPQDQDEGFSRQVSGFSTQLFPRSSFRCRA